MKLCVDDVLWEEDEEDDNAILWLMVNWLEDDNIDVDDQERAEFHIPLWGGP